MPLRLRNCFEFDGVIHAKAIGKENPITGQHVELILEKSENSFTKMFLQVSLKKLPKHMFH